MRLAIISDVHGNLLALETVLADIRHRAPDATVNLGDLATSPLWPRETVELLDTLSMPTVRGNHDRFLSHPTADGMTPSVEFTLGALTDAQRGMLDALPRTLEMAGGVLAVHGTPESDVEYLLEDKIDERLSLVGPARLAQRLGDVTASLVLCGHSHHQHMAHAPGGRLVVNPGSVGCPRYADNEDAHLAEAYTPHARYAIATQRGGQWSIESIALAYDWNAVAAQAVANGRPDWARRFLGALA